MFLKERSRNKELIRFRSLYLRAELSATDKKNYLNLEKGYQGEVMFDQFTSTLQNEFYIINDLCLKLNTTTFQIDSLLISQKALLIFEIKNFEGNFYYDKENFFIVSGDAIQNPLDQVNRSSILLRKFLTSIGTNYSIEGSVVFINPKFTLYQAPLNKPIIYPTQITSTMEKLEQTPSKLNTVHKNLADKLISLHQEDVPFNNLPPYHFSKLAKGVISSECDSFMVPSDSGNQFVCLKCGLVECVDSVVMRSAKELMLLFPGIRLTTSVVYEWCGGLVSRKVIRRVLMSEFKMVGHQRWVYFE